MLRASVVAGVLDKTRGSAVRRFVNKARMTARSVMSAAAFAVKVVVGGFVAITDGCVSRDMKEWLD